MEKRKEGLTMIQCTAEHRDLLKKLAAKSEVTQLNYLIGLINAAADGEGLETPDSTPVERETDRKILAGDFNDTGRGKAKKDRWQTYTFPENGKTYKFRELQGYGYAEDTDLWNSYTSVTKCAYAEFHDTVLHPERVASGHGWKGNMEFEYSYQRCRS